mgnify:CR=1 FL=1
MVETKEAVEEEISSIKVETEEERPVLNVSFFSEPVKPFEAEESKSIVEDLKIQNESLEEDSNSNIPKFINTWQSWLNIEKTEPAIDETLEDDIVEETIVEEVEEKVPEVIKNKAIETFIETNPKISKMKEESDFIVKERSENISHLMTETLAMLYLQQKLYTKAIGGFQILSFLVRRFLNYKKSKFYKIYGFLLIPVWITFLLSIFLQGKNIDLGILNQMGVIFYLMLYSAFFYAPILSMIYIYDINQNIKNYEKSNI